MNLLKENPNITTRQIAEQTGISNGSAYYCVTALIDKGFVKLRKLANTSKKGNVFYELTPRGMREKASLAIQFLELKRQEYHDLKVEIRRLEDEVDNANKNSLGKLKDTI